MLQNTPPPWTLGFGLVPSSLAYLVPTILVLSFLLFTPIEENDDLTTRSTSPPELDQSVGEIAKGYFETQFDFLRNGFHNTASSVFQFKLNRRSVIAVSGEEARNTFLREKSLNLYEGFQVIVGTVWDQHPFSISLKS